MSVDATDATNLQKNTTTTETLENTDKDSLVCRRNKK